MVLVMEVVMVLMDAEHQIASVVVNVDGQQIVVEYWLEHNDIVSLYIMLLAKSNQMLYRKITLTGTGTGAGAGAGAGRRAANRC